MKIVFGGLILALQKIISRLGEMMVALRFGDWIPFSIGNICIRILESESSGPFGAPNVRS